MKPNQVKFLKSVLGQDIMDVLAKSELYKPDTKTTVDPAEIKVALQIVPRTILTWLIVTLKPMRNGDSLEVDLPFAPGKIHINKLGADVYSGEVYTEEHKKVYEFKYRSLPSVGLVLLSTFELYELPKEDLEVTQQVDTESSNKLDSLQDLIDQRLKLNDIIRNVVDQKLSERDALQHMLFMKLKESFTKPEESPMTDKKLKLREFLDSRQKKTEELDKSEIKCPDCTSTLFKSGDSHIKCCICYGEHRNKEIKFEKNESGVKLKFPKTFDQENIEMLLDCLKRSKK